jgi:hypothetical protein
MSVLDALPIYINLHEHEFGPPPCQCSFVVVVINAAALSTEAARSSRCNIACYKVISIG